MALILCILVTAQRHEDPDIYSANGIGNHTIQLAHTAQDRQPTIVDNQETGEPLLYMITMMRTTDGFRKSVHQYR